MSTEIRQVTIQIASCSKQNPYGLVETGYYMVENGFVQMCTEAGKPIGKKVPLDGDDPARIAGRLTREAFAKQPRANSFNRAISYPPSGIV
jgi:hypothetical protein